MVFVVAKATNDIYLFGRADESFWFRAASLPVSAVKCGASTENLNSVSKGVFFSRKINQLRVEVIIRGRKTI